MNDSAQYNVPLVHQGDDDDDVHATRLLVRRSPSAEPTSRPREAFFLSLAVAVVVLISALTLATFSRSSAPSTGLLYRVESNWVVDRPLASVPPARGDSLELLTIDTDTCRPVRDRRRAVLLCVSAVRDAEEEDTSAGD